MRLVGDAIAVVVVLRWNESEFNLRCDHFMSTSTASHRNAIAWPSAAATRARENTSGKSRELRIANCHPK